MGEGVILRRKFIMETPLSASNETGGFASLPHGRFAFVIDSRRVSQVKTNCQLNK
jgi:hypothetical protein